MRRKRRGLGLLLALLVLLGATVAARKLTPKREAPAETPALTAPSAPKVQLEKPPVTDAASADTADQSAE